MRLLICLFFAAGAIAGCGRGGDSNLFVDHNGFVLNAGQGQPIVRVGVGMSANQFLEKNPALRGVAWVPSPSNVFDEFRLSLQTPATLEYDDGLMKLSVCTYSTSVDGNQDLKVGVASVGFTVCNPPLDDIEAAVQQASSLLATLEKQQPKVVNLGEVYRTATQETLTKIGGKQWQDVAVKHFPTLPPPREDPTSMDHLKTLEQARVYFESRKVHGVAKRRPDGRIDVGLVLVGVYATDKAIVEVGVSGAEAFGGESLSAEQRNAIRYQVGMTIRLRPL